MRHLTPQTLRLPARAQHQADYTESPQHANWRVFWDAYFGIIDTAELILQRFGTKVL